MFIKLNKITLYVNFNKHKREYIVIPIIPIGGIHLHLYQNNLTYHFTSKNMTEKNFIITQTQMENKTIYHSINTKNNY